MTELEIRGDYPFDGPRWNRAEPIHTERPTRLDEIKNFYLEACLGFEVRLYQSVGRKEVTGGVDRLLPCHLVSDAQSSEGAHRAGGSTSILNLFNWAHDV